MAIEVFNRYENKYLINAEMYNKLQNRISDYMEPDAYNRQHETYSITNLYFDTEDNLLIRTSLSKPVYKEKLRLRAYGVPSGDSRVYVEIKKKFKGLTNKRRSEIALDEAYEFLQSGNIPELHPCMNTQVLHEIEYILERHSLRPALYLAYERRAYFGIGRHDLRVSFDSNIRSRRTDLLLEAGDYGTELLPGDMRLMEIKAAQSIPVWLSRLLSEYDIFPTAFSKYGTEYMQTMAGRSPQRVQGFVPEPRVLPGIAPLKVLNAAY